MSEATLFFGQLALALAGAAICMALIGLILWMIIAVAKRLRELQRL